MNNKLHEQKKYEHKFIRTKNLNEQNFKWRNKLNEQKKVTNITT